MKLGNGLAVLVLSMLLLLSATNRRTVVGEIYGTALHELPDYCYSVLFSDVDVERYVYSAASSPGSRPIINASQAVTVSFGIVFQRIVDVFEKESVISVEAYLILEWKNEFINWQDVMPINCSKKMIAPSDKVWIPDISVVNAADKYSLLLIRGHKVEVTYDGMCDFYPSGVFNASCSLNLRYFPFDDQLCILRFAGWSYPTDMQKLTAQLATPIAYDHFQEHVQWALENAEAINSQTFVRAEGRTYDEVQIVLHLRRKPVYYVINIVIPVLIISFVEITTFALPITNNIKIHISFTTLVAFGMFQLLILDDMPRDSGGSLPLLTIYLDLTVAYIGAVLAGEGIIFYFIRKAEQNRKQKPPKWLFGKISALGKLFSVKSCSKKIKPTTATDGRHQNNIRSALLSTSLWSVSIMTANLNELVSKTIEKAKQRKVAKISRHEGRRNAVQNWMFLAEIVERLLLLTYLAALVITPIVIYLIMPSGG